MLQRIKDFFVNVWQYAWRHKIISAIVLAVIIIAGYFGYKSMTNTKAETRYILTSIEKGTITTSVSGTGQISSAQEKNVQPKVAGEITYFNSNVKAGNSIAKGTLIATIDNSDALETVDKAEESLESAKITYSKLVGADESNPKNKQDAEKELAKAYEDGYNDVASVFLDLPSIVKGLDSILHDNTINTNQDNIDYYTYTAYTFDDKAELYKTAAEKSYATAKAAYDKNFENYKTSSMYSSTTEIDSLIDETYVTSKLISQAIKDAINVIQFYEDVLTENSIKTSSYADTHTTSLSSYLSKANSDVSSLFSTTNTIENDIETLEDCDDEIRTAKLNVTSAERTLANAKEALSNYSVYAPLTGVVSASDISVGDEVSSGTTLATVITKSKIAEITLSETDIANVKVGDKANLTFDAIEDLSIVGQVSQVDLVGSASSGVVSYGLEIAFDTDDDSVKSGMSVSATIITNAKSDVLILPSTAVKSNDDSTYYVQVLSKEYDLTDKTNSIKGVTSATAPTTKTVTIGLADDTNTEIASGLSEGDQVVVRVSSSSTGSSSSSSSSSKSSGSNSILNTGGGGGMQGPPGM